MSLLLVATLGAALISGWQWWTLVLLPPATIGFFHLSDSLYDSGVEYRPYHPLLIYGLLLIPVAIALGAMAVRLAGRPASAAGVVLTLLPIVAFAWAGFRHARPIDRRTAVPYLVQHPALPQSPSYRGVRIGDSRRRLLSLLGQPDRIVPRSDSDSEYVYGKDTFVYATSELTGTITRRDLVTDIIVRDAKGETPEGVGIGDNLALVQQRIPGVACFIALGSHDPGCQTNDTYGGASGYAYVWFQGDPIAMIEIGGIPPG